MNRIFGEGPNFQISDGPSESPPNFERLVLDCVDADFCKVIFVGIGILFEKEVERRGQGRKLLTRYTRFTYFCTAQTSDFQEISSNSYFLFFFKR